MTTPPPHDPSRETTEISRMQSSITTARIETLADGVFAIVMTLLVFDIRVPVQEAVDQFGLLGALLTLTPNLLSYVISFVILGVLWVGHHNQFFYIRRADRQLLWINIVFLMCVALLPFSAALVARYGGDRVALIVYDINLILAGLVLFWHWMYGTRDSHLTNQTIDPDVRRRVNRRILIPPTLYGLAILIAFISTEASFVIDILVPILYAFPTRIDHLFRRG